MKHLKIPSLRLPKPINVHGYDGNSQQPVTHAVRLCFHLNDRAFYNTPFIIVDIGQTDVIIGRRFFDRHDIGIDCRGRQLVWPNNIPPYHSGRKLIYLDPLILSPKCLTQPDRGHQADAERRDRNLQLDEKRREDGRQAGILVLNKKLMSAINQLEYKIDQNLVSQDPIPPPIVDHDSDGDSGYISDERNAPPRRTAHTRKNHRGSGISHQPIYESEEPPSFLRPEYHERRAEEAMAPEIKTLRRTNYRDRITHAESQEKAYTIMNQALRGTFSPSLQKTRKRAPLDMKGIAISVISGNNMRYTLRRNDVELGSVSFYEINTTLDERRQELEEETRASEIKMPKEYAKYAPLASKIRSNELPPRRKYDHKIELTGDINNLRLSPLYKMSTEELEVVKQYLQDNLDKGFIEPSTAAWAAPVMFVRKKDGSLRFCIDFRALNDITKKNKYPIPLMEETLARISRAKIFTKLDIRQAFHRIRMDADSEELTSFRTRYGQYKCKVLPFGLTNGPATFQHYMNDVLFEYLDNFCTAYMDDILIFSEDPLEHQAHVEKVLQRLQSAGLQIDLKKCEWNVTSTKYLGFVITTSGIRADPDKLSVIHEWQYPKTVKGVQSYLGFCNFYRRFIRDYGRIAKPLTELSKNGVVFRFTPECERAFDQLKECLLSDTVLRYYDQDLKCKIETDASDGVVAGVLSQLHPDGWHPVAFFSKTMSKAELNYEVHDKEMLAIIKSMKNWRPELLGQDKFQVITDHKSLEYFMSTKELTGRQARWAEALSQYDFMISYRPGKENAAADALSRREQDVTPQDKIKAENRTCTLLHADQIDPEVLRDCGIPINEIDISPVEDESELEDDLFIIDRLLQANRTNKSLELSRERARRDPTSGLTLDDGLLMYQGRLVIPVDGTLTTDLIREAHEQISMAHPGRDKTYKALRSRYYWPGMIQMIARYIRNCHACQRSHVPRDKTPGLLHPLPVPDQLWQHLTMDFKSFPPDKNGYDALFVVIDRLGKKAISVPCHKTCTARDLAQIYLTHVYRHHGTPESIVSDRGPQFISDFWNEFCRILGIKVKLSTADKASTDGQTEIMNQYIDQRLRPYLDYYQDNWSQMMPMMDHAQLTLVQESIGMSPFKLLHGYEARTSFDWNTPAPHTPTETLNREAAIEIVKDMDKAREIAKSHMQQAQARQAIQANKSRRSVDFTKGDYAYLHLKSWETERPSKKLDDQRGGPYLITDTPGHSFKLQLPDNAKIHDVHPPERLRKAAMDPLPGQRNEEQGPIVFKGEDEWEVEKFLGSKIHYGRVFYRVDWKNRDPDYEWWPAGDFKYAPHLMRNYHAANPTRAGPARSMQRWIELYDSGEDEYEYENDEKPVNPEKGLSNAQLRRARKGSRGHH